jgi:hypothetical protein
MKDKNQPPSTPRQDQFSKRGGKVPTGGPAAGLRPPSGGGTSKPSSRPRPKQSD